MSEWRDEIDLRKTSVSLSLIIAALWAVSASGVAMLPMRYQYVPGVALLVAAPVLIGVLAFEHGFWVGLFGLFAFVSMFRNPLKYFWNRARGGNAEEPR